MTPRDACYTADHPVTLALLALCGVMRTGGNLLETLAKQAASVGVPFGSTTFDEAAAMAGLPYSRAWDVYVDRETWARAERWPLAHMPH